MCFIRKFLDKISAGFKESFLVVLCCFGALHLDFILLQHESIRGHKTKTKKT